MPARSTRIERAARRWACGSAIALVVGSMIGSRRVPAAGGAGALRRRQPGRLGASRCAARCCWPRRSPGSPRMAAQRRAVCLRARRVRRRRRLRRRLELLDLDLVAATPRSRSRSPAASARSVPGGDGDAGRAAPPVRWSRCGSAPRSTSSGVRAGRAACRCVADRAQAAAAAAVRRRRAVVSSIGSTTLPFNPERQVAVPPSRRSRWR